ncbi:MAG: ABC transporter substrate-binding protein [Thermodesulfobacteriota bacterium]
MFKRTFIPGRFVLLLIHGALTVLVLLAWLIPEIPASPAGRGRQVFAPAPPRRLVSLAPSITEILYFLEAGDRLVGVTSYCNFPPEVKNKPRVGTYWEFNLEAILALKPDLVLAMAHQGEGPGSLQVLQHWKIPSYLGRADTLPQLFGLIEDLARLTGREEVARRKLPALKARARRVQERVQGLPRPRVLLEIDQEPLITVGRTSIQGDLIQRAGGANIAGKVNQRYPVFNLEEVLKSRPEVILFTGMADASSLPRRMNFWRQWTMLPAVRAGRLYWVEPDLVDRPGPRLVDGLELLANYFHPQ